MENTTQLINCPPFNEAEWIRLIFLLSDTQQWMNQMILNAFIQVPLKDRKKLFRKSYYITVTALAHILERHYYTIPRHPAASKFTVPLIELLSFLRDSSTEPTTPIPGTLQFKRTLALDKTIGIDFDHVPTCLLTILTDAGGHGKLTKWDFLPRSLSYKEFANPYRVFKRFFRFQDITNWKEQLQLLMDYSLRSMNLLELENIRPLSLYFQLTKLVEAAHLIDVREVNHVGGHIKNRISKRRL